MSQYERRTLSLSPRKGAHNMNSKLREQGIQLPVSHTLSDHHICHGVRPLGMPCQEWQFFFIKHKLHVNG